MKLEASSRSSRSLVLAAAILDNSVEESHGNNVQRKASSNMGVHDMKEPKEQASFMPPKFNPQVDLNTFQMKEDNNFHRDLPGYFSQSVKNVTGLNTGDFNLHKNSDKASKVGAQAYSSGSEIHFAPGKFDMSSQAGKHLAAHEFAHGTQKKGLTATKEVNGMPVNDDPQLESAADAMADQVVQGKGQEGLSKPTIENSTVLQGLFGRSVSDGILEGLKDGTTPDLEKNEGHKKYENHMEDVTVRAIRMTTFGDNIDPIKNFAARCLFHGVYMRNNAESGLYTSEDELEAARRMIKLGSSAVRAANGLENLYKVYFDEMHQQHIDKKHIAWINRFEAAVSISDFVQKLDSTEIKWSFDTPDENEKWAKEIADIFTAGSTAITDICRVIHMPATIKLFAEVCAHHLALPAKIVDTFIALINKRDDRIKEAAGFDDNGAIGRGAGGEWKGALARFYAHSHPELQSFMGLHKHDEYIGVDFEKLPYEDGIDFLRELVLESVISAEQKQKWLHRIDDGA